MISTSLMTAGEASNQYFFPKKLMFENYYEVWTSNRFQRYTVNSLIISSITVTGVLITSIPAAYSFAKINFPFKNITVQSDLSKALLNADVIMPLRIQSERQNLGLLTSIREYSSQFGLSNKLLKITNTNSIVMHPGPMNEGIEIDSNVAHSNRSFILKQVENGVAIRMAILSKIINAEKET